MSESSGSMVINIGRQGSFEAVASGLTMQRVSELAAAGTTPPYVLAAPDMQPAAHLGGHKLAFDTGGPALVVTFLPGPDHEVTLSDARYGATGTWAPGVTASGRRNSRRPGMPEGQARDP